MTFFSFRHQQSNILIITLFIHNILKIRIYKILSNSITHFLLVINFFYLLLLTEFVWFFFIFGLFSFYFLPSSFFTFFNFLFSSFILLLCCSSYSLHLSFNDSTTIYFSSNSLTYPSSTGLLGVSTSLKSN